VAVMVMEITVMGVMAMGTVMGTAMAILLNNNV
jgi:hypothetical protein